MIGLHLEGHGFGLVWFLALRHMAFTSSNYLMFQSKKLLTCIYVSIHTCICETNDN